MTTWTLVKRGLRFYWRTHVGVVLGAAVASAVLVGALVVGDSVRYSLQQVALARLGKVRLALAPQGRLFRAALAGELKPALEAETVPVLQLRGIAVKGDGSARANDVQIIGAGKDFWPLAERPVAIEQPDETVVLNERLARQLGVGKGSEILLRIEKPSSLSRDAPLSTTEDASLALRPTVLAIVPDSALGRYSLRANQVAPFNAFLPLSWLQKKLGLEGKANALLVGETALPAEQADAALREHWQLADAGLALRDVPGQGLVELGTDRIFLDPPVEAAARKAFPAATGILTYFVNELRLGGRATPYSMVAAIGRLDGARGVPGLKPEDLADDEILINTWEADDLGAKPGDSLELTYFVLGPMRKLEESKSTFKVRAVLPLEGLAADRTLMPDFPGLANVENSRRDWKPGIPIDRNRIRPKDEAYWKDNRGTPKAFVTLAAGQKIWKNRFGDLTAIRFAAPRDEVAKAIAANVGPEALGLFFQPVRAQALAASTQAMDFGQLFLGLSFFLIIAAVLLTALLFVFGVEQRTEEVGTLLAVGFPPRRVRRLLLAEGGALALVGCVAGAAAGTLYTRVVLHGLSGVWSGAVADSAIQYHAEGLTLAVGGISGFFVALLAMWIVLRKQGRRPARELLAGPGALEPARIKGARRTSLWVGLGSILVALALVAVVGARRDRAAAGVFFGAGSLLLLGGIALSHALLARVARRAGSVRLTLGGMGWRNGARRRSRSLAVVGLLAVGSFLVISVGANRQDPAAGAEERSSGTGGFALLGESAMPVYVDLNGEAGREAFALDEKDMADVKVVPLRVHAGDDASCLNLNRAQQPRLLGVRPEELQSRGAFSFASAPEAEGEPWMLLARQAGKDVVPAIGDEATVTWGLAKSVGDTLDYTDERGRPFKVKIVGVIGNSMLQGSLLIAEDAFVERFPSDSGYRMFLIDAPWGRAAEASKALSQALEDVGLEVAPSATRLAEFGTVENTYLSIFQALGALGMLLGSIGLGIVVLRNVLERRSELALLRAVGFRRLALQWFVLSEHWGLVLLGLATGVVAAVVAVVPALRTPGAEVPYAALAATVAAIVASGLVWTWLAAVLALRGRLLNALRNE